MTQLVIDNVTKIRKIITNNPECKNCKKTLPEGTEAYMQQITNTIYCIECLKKGKVRQDTIEAQYFLGTIKEEQ